MNRARFEKSRAKRGFFRRSLAAAARLVPWFTSGGDGIAAARFPPRLGALHTPPRHGLDGHATTLHVVGYLMSTVLMLPAAAQEAQNFAEMADVAPLASKALLLDIAKAGKRFVAVGERGQVLLSDDEGRNWEQAREVPTRVLLTAVCFRDARQGIAVGHDETIIVTKDSGETWQRAHYAPEAQQPLLDVWCGPSGRAIAVGAYGTYYESGDGGASWRARRLEAKATRPNARPESEYDEEIAGDPHLNRIVEATATRFFIAGEAGHLYLSDDAGAIWTELVSPYEGSFFGILPLGENLLLAYGLRGHLFRSEDAGASWTKIETGTVAMLNDAVRTGTNEVVVVGLSGVLLASGDGGRRFSLHQQEDRKGMSAVVADGAGEVITAGEGGVKRIPVGATP